MLSEIESLHDGLVVDVFPPSQARSKLRHHSAAVQVPIGLEEHFQGLVDLVQLKTYLFEGSNGCACCAFTLLVTLQYIDLLYNQCLIFQGKSCHCGSSCGYGSFSGGKAA